MAVVINKARIFLDGREVEHWLAADARDGWVDTTEPLSWCPIPDPQPVLFPRWRYHGAVTFFGPTNAD